MQPGGGKAVWGGAWGMVSGQTQGFQERLGSRVHTAVGLGGQELSCICPSCGT